MVQEDQFVREAAALSQTLYRIGYSILHREQDVQDAVQQALSRAWERREKARPDGFKAWLTKIVLNECRNIQRYRMRVTPVSQVEETAAEAYEPPDPALREALDALSQKMRTPFLMRYMEGYTEAETAQALHLPVGTVKSRVSKARALLREQLAGKEADGIWKEDHSTPMI